MLYFRFNIDNFIAPQQECTVIEYKDGKNTALPQIKICEINFGQIQSAFFKKLIDDLSLTVCGTSNALYDAIGVPMDAFNIDNEEIGKFDGVIKLALSEYEKQPIKQLNGKSLNDLGITIEFCNKISNNEVNSKLRQYMQANNFSYLTEEILWKNMSMGEKTEKFVEYLAEISVEGKELIIVDPYIFSCVEDEYCSMLASILCQSKAKKIIAITQKSNCKKACCDKILSKISNTEVKFSDDFHDRFWIANRKTGFCAGTSLNGIGKKISRINMLCDDEVADIISELSSRSLLI